jgi:putative peptidoglycan lipid II flippase
MLIKVLAPGYFSRQDMKTPVKIAIKAMVVNMVFNLLLIGPLDHVGLALATSLSAFLNAGLLLSGLIREKVYEWQPGWRVFLLRLGAALGALIGFILWVNPAVEVWMAGGLWLRVGYTSLLVLGGAALYLFVLVLCGLRLKHIRA